MSITVNIYYTSVNGAARAFAEDGNLRYEYFFPMNDPETVLLIDSWRDQTALDKHHESRMMAQIAALREKYDLHMKVERYVSVDESPEDEKFIRS